MTIDDYIEQRNRIQLEAEAISEDRAFLCWRNLGVANRHIERVVGGMLTLTPGVEKEIQDCLELAACLMSEGYTRL